MRIISKIINPDPDSVAYLSDHYFFTIFDDDKWNIREFFIIILSCREFKDYVIKYTESLDTLYVYCKSWNMLFDIQEHILSGLKHK